ncbi:MAG: TIGR00266 family protein, partial [Methylococcaceae bacterium]
TGTVYLQSLPFSRLANRVLQASSGMSSKGEGSVIGGLGDLFGD